MKAILALLLIACVLFAACTTKVSQTQETNVAGTVSADPLTASFDQSLNNQTDPDADAYGNLNSLDSDLATLG